MENLSRFRSTSRQFFLFVIAAGLSVPVNLASRVVFSAFIPFGLAVLLAHLVGMVTAFALARIFVFDKSGRSVRLELSRFALVNVVSASTTWAVSVTLLYRVFPTLEWTTFPEFSAHLSGLASSAVVSFLGHRHFSFRPAV